jgi:MerR family transcriptional regulator, thiopeptide resistance regulator
MSSRTYQVNEAARMAGVTVRALHHYDEIGLLVPSNRTEAGYRLYTAEDLLRLQQILIGRTLGLSLEEIRKLLDDPLLDRRTLLQRQREALQKRAETTAAMLRSVDVALALVDDTHRSENVNLREIFDGFDPAQYQDDARERWGHTHAYLESQRRVRQYSANDWRTIKADMNAVITDAAAALRASCDPESVEAMDIAERARLNIDRWFYPCSREMHSRLADMYEADERFAANYERYEKGLTAFFAAAIRANARRRHA